MNTHDPLDVNAMQKSRAAMGREAVVSRDLEAADLKWLMGSRRGRRIVWRLLDQAGVFRLSFNTNAMQMAFAEGGRNAGLRLLAQVHALCPQLYPLMVAECGPQVPGQGEARRPSAESEDGVEGQQSM